MNVEDPIFKSLLEENRQFSKLYQEHCKYEGQLDELDKAHHLTPQQEMQRKTLQKLKLSGKDRMSIMMQESSGT
jgi:uncharacterized protein YdcH (DUF465 family)